ncbi:MAG: ATP-binding protein [Proteobacteria bacterium]|nr:ATP-binding protein [Pseudomonadota bacterium]
MTTMNSPAPLIHLVCGSTGAGKTTHALKLEDQLGAVRFSIDEWMHGLFWADSPRPPQLAWSLERVERCYARIWATARMVAARGVPCVLDLGFTTRAARNRFVAAAAADGLGAQLHWIDVPAEERWRRVEARNAGDGATRHLDFAITRAMFDGIERMWEAPDEAEMQAAHGLRVSG